MTGFLWEQIQQKHEIHEKALHLEGTRNTTRNFQTTVMKPSLTRMPIQIMKKNHRPSVYFSFIFVHLTSLAWEFIDVNTDSAFFIPYFSKVIWTNPYDLRKFHFLFFPLLFFSDCWNWNMGLNSIINVKIASAKGFMFICDQKISFFYLLQISNSFFTTMFSLPRHHCLFRAWRKHLTWLDWSIHFSI